MTEKVKITRKDLRAMHQMKVAALKAEHAREVTEYEADLQASRGREIRLRNELAAANEAWAQSEAKVRVLRTHEATLVAERDAAHRNVDAAVASGDEARNELAVLRRQLRDIRTALEPLTSAVFPPSLPSYGERSLLDLKGRLDRLNEAGYNCYPQGQHDTYSQGDN